MKLEVSGDLNVTNERGFGRFEYEIHYWKELHRLIACFCWDCMCEQNTLIAIKSVDDLNTLYILLRKRLPGARHFLK